MEGRDDWFFGKIVDGTGVGAEALQFGLFFRQGLSRGFVGFIGSQPDLVAKRDGIIVDRENVGFTHALAKIAVLLVVAYAHHDAKDA